MRRLKSRWVGSIPIHSRFLAGVKARWQSGILAGGIVPVQMGPDFQRVYAVFRLPSKDIVLIGAGHTNLHVVRMWGEAPVPDARLTLISPGSVATYSGMLPGTLAGLYGPDQMLIDLHRLTQSNNVRLISGACEGIDVPGRRIKVAGRPSIRFDVASVGVGSVPANAEVGQNHPGFVNIKPMFSFLDRLHSVLRTIESGRVRVAVIGAGAAGVEIAFCFQQHLRTSHRDADLFLIDAHEHVLKNYKVHTRKLVTAELHRRRIQLLFTQRVVRCEGTELQFQAGGSLDVDVVLWCVGAEAPSLLQAIDLPKSPSGFLLTDDSLLTTAGESIFAVGDCGELHIHDVPRAGVYAVRQAPVLKENLHRILAGQPLKAYHPQRDFLSLLATGDGRAFFQWRSWSGYGRWWWKLKNSIDLKFLKKHEPATMLNHRPERHATTSAGVRMNRSTVLKNRTGQMRCRGCGGKTSGRVLHAVLERLRRECSNGESLFLQPEDAACLTGSRGPVDIVSVDFFDAFIDDPWLMGRIAALHGLSDLWARGVRPTVALAMITLPEGNAAQQTELLYQVLAGAIHELSASRVTLAGGHTMDGESLSIGFTTLGQTAGHPCFSKSGAQPGDRLILTRPLGTGVVLAAHAILRAEGSSVDGMLASMLRGNSAAAGVARSHGICCVTDVTGFGLAGHLMEILNASQVDALIALSEVRLLSGAAACFQAGIRSSLDTENRWVEQHFQTVDPQQQTRPEWAALFDPQTSGGLLLSVPAHLESQVLNDLKCAGDIDAATIGHIHAMQCTNVRVTVTDERLG